MALSFLTFGEVSSDCSMSSRFSLFSLIAPSLLLSLGMPSVSGLSVSPNFVASALAETSDTAATLRQDGRRLHYSGQLAAALATLQRALEQEQQSRNRAGEAATWVALGEVHISLGGKTAAAEAAQQALTLYQELEDPVGEANALRILAFSQFEDTPNEAAIATVQQAIVLARESGSPVQQGILLAELGVFRIRTQEFEAGLAHIHEAQPLLEAEPASPYESQLRDYYQPFILAFTGLAQFRLDASEAAMNSFAEAIAAGQSTDNPNGEAVAHFFKGLVLAEQGETAEALLSQQQAAELFAAAENVASQFEALVQIGGTLHSQGNAYGESGQIDEAIATYQQAVAAHQEALQFARSLENAELIARALHEIAGEYIYMTQLLQTNADSLLEAQDFAVAQATIMRAIELGQQAIQPAVEALTLASIHGNEALTNQSHLTVHIAHTASAQAYEKQSQIYIAEGKFEDSVAPRQEALSLFEAGLRYALESGDAESVARSRLGIALAHNGIGQSYNTLGQNFEGIAAARSAIEVSQQIPARGMTLLALTNLQQNEYDASEIFKQAGDLEQALAYAEQALISSEQTLALVDEKLEIRSAVPIADILPDFTIVDTVEEQQYWAGIALNHLWISFNQIAFIYDDQARYVEALEFYQKALVVAERLGDPATQFTTLGSISAAHVRLSQYQEAIAIEAKAAQIAEQTSDAEMLLASNLSRARIYDDLGRYPEALEAYDTVLTLSKELGLLAREATVLNNLAIILTLQGNYRAALENLNQNLSITRTIRNELESPDALDKLEEYCYLTATGRSFSESREDEQSSSNLDEPNVSTAAYEAFLEGKSAEYVRNLCLESTWHSEQKTLNNIAFVYSNQGQYQEALELYEQSLEIARQWDDRFDEANILNNIGALYFSRGDYRPALEFHQEALAMRQEIGDRAGAAQTLNDIATVYNSQGKYSQALSNYEEGLALIRAIGVKPQEPTFLGNIGTIYSEQGRYEESEAYYQQSLELSQTLGFLPDQAVQLKNLGVLASERGNYTEALEYAQQSLAIYRDIGTRIGEGAVLRDVGYVYQAQGNFADSFAVHQDALAIAQDRADQDDEAYALLALGSTYERLGQYDQAASFYQDALTIFEAIGSVAGEANALSSLGNTADAQERYDEALKLYEQAFAIYQETGSIEGESAVLIDIGFVQSQLDNFEAAETALQQALRMQRQIGARSNEGTTLAGLALVRREQGTSQAALNLWQEALALHQELGDRPNEASVLSDMGQLLAAEDRPELAITLLKQSVNLYESIRGELRTLETGLQASYTDSVADTYRTLADLLLQQNRILEAQRVLDLLKIQELDEYFQDVQRSAQTASGIDFWQVEEDLLALYQQVLEQTTELQALEAKSRESLTAQEQQRLNELQATRDQAEGWFYDFLDNPTVIDTVDQIRANSRGQNLEPENFPDLANNLRLLPQKTAALYPLILEDRLELVLVMPEGPPLRYPVAVSAQELNRVIVNFGQALKSPGSEIEPLAQQLYTWLIAPLAAQLEQAGIEAIVYAPDGALRYVPLAALHDGEQYLAQRFSISHITAASLTDLNVQPQRQDRRLLAAACAECEFTVNVGDAEFTFPDLPFTEVEVKTLAEQVAGVDVLLNQEFNSDALSNLSGYDIVHLATHAAFVTGSPDESFIVFGSGETINLRNIKREWTLDNTELVVLSACETAVGSADLGSGVEILGLGYRIEQAGAQATLASLWQVSDGGTQILMQAFYDALQQGMSKSEALQAAQQAMITSDFSAVGGDRGGLSVVFNDGASAGRSPNTNASLTHPYYWAPFILIGNGL